MTYYSGQTSAISQVNKQQKNYFLAKTYIFPVVGYITPSFKHKPRNTFPRSAESLKFGKMCKSAMGDSYRTLTLPKSGKDAGSLESRTFHFLRAFWKS